MCRSGRRWRVWAEIVRNFVQSERGGRPSDGNVGGVAVGIGNLHAPTPDSGHVAGALQQVSALGQLPGQFMTGRDVQVSPVHPLGLTLGSAGHQLTSIGYPHPVTVLVPHSNFNFVEVGFAVKVVMQRLLRCAEVPRVAECFPGVDRYGLQLGEGVPDDLGPPLVESALAGLYVPFPGSGVCAG